MKPNTTGYPGAWWLANQFTGESHQILQEIIDYWDKWCVEQWKANPIYPEIDANFRLTF